VTAENHTGNGAAWVLDGHVREQAGRWGISGTSQPIAAKHTGINANTLTDDSAIDVPSGNAVFNGVPVTLSRA
jgi:hypothetical protein